MLSRGDPDAEESLRKSIHGVLGNDVCGHPRIITTIAGTDWTFPDDGGSAVESAIGRISSIAIDGAGNLYLSDVDNFQMMKVFPDGIITVLAGNGIPGFSGEGGPARSASLRLPYGIAIDRDGNAYLALASQHRVLRVSREGLITTVAGTGHAGFSGDGGPGRAANLSNPRGLALDGLVISILQIPTITESGS